MFSRFFIQYVSVKFKIPSILTFQGHIWRSAMLLYFSNRNLFYHKTSSRFRFSAGPTGGLIKPSKPFWKIQKHIENIFHTTIIINRRLQPMGHTIGTEARRLHAFIFYYLISLPMHHISRGPRVFFSLIFKLQSRVNRHKQTHVGFSAFALPCSARKEHPFFKHTHTHIVPTDRHRTEEEPIFCFQLILHFFSILTANVCREEGKKPREHFKLKSHHWQQYVCVCVFVAMLHWSWVNGQSHKYAPKGVRWWLPSGLNQMVALPKVTSHRHPPKQSVPFRPKKKRSGFG